VTLSTLPTLLIVGDESTLGYLLGRYAETSGYRVHAVPAASSAAEVCALEPAAVFFPSVENLKAARELVAELAKCDIPLFVCSSAADEADARELGADYCLLHPITYDTFLAALTATNARHAMAEQEHAQPRPADPEERV